MPLRSEDAIRMAPFHIRFTIGLTTPSLAGNRSSSAADGHRVEQMVQMRRLALLHRNGYGMAQTCYMMADGPCDIAEKVYGSDRYRT